MRADLGTYRRLLTYAYPYRWRLIIGLLFGALFGGSTFGMLMAFQSGFAQVFGSAETPLTTWVTQRVADLGDPGKTPLYVTVAVLALLPLAGILRGVGFFISKYYVEWVGNRVVMDLRTALFGHLADLSVQYISHSRTGELISRTTNDTQMVQRAVSSVIGDIVREPFVLMAGIAALLTLDARLAAISLLVFPICIIPVSVFGRRVRRYAKEGQALLADLASIQQEAIVGSRIVKAFGMENFEKGKFLSRCRAVFRRHVKVTAARAAVMPFIELISIIAGCLVLLYARWSGLRWDQLLTFLGALLVMYEPVKKLTRLHLTVQQSAAAADRIFEILDTEVTVQDRPGAVPLDGPVADIELRDVSFAYDDEPVLNEVRLQVKAGECVALVGSSGAGKTTLVGLLPRFFDPTGGCVCVNGKDVRDYTLESLRGQIGLVTQETILFNDTIAHNIAYGRADMPQQAIEEAARRAHAHDFIMAMPHGYDSVIGERGSLLSGGQRQRLAIARALLRNPPILILDEATSALDTESERQVQAALNELMEGRTVFAIAHRLSTIRHADRIVVLESGRIVEEGPHDDLLAQGGVYKYLYDLQFADDEHTP
jgi:subfamily B ATP-binding cassette protein MsbA